MSRLAHFALFLILVLPAPLQAQEWTADISLKNLAAEQKRALVKGIAKVPGRALELLLREEATHLEKLHRDDLEAFAQNARTRIILGKEDGHLFRAVRHELRLASVYTPQLLAKVWKEERARLHTFPERITYAMVDQALRAVLIDRIRAVRNRRVEVFRATTSTGTARPAEFPLALPTERFRWSKTKDEGVNVGSKLPIPKVRFFSKGASFQEALLKRTYNTRLGRLNVTAAEVTGLAEAQAGRVEYRDALGRRVEGLGVDFRARARVTGARGDFRGKDLKARLGDSLGITAYLNAMAQVASNADSRVSALVSERGAGFHASVRAGAGAEARAQLPMTIDLKLIKLRVIPYVTAHAGAAAEAHATFEIEWSGKLRMDLGATLSTGVGAGAGLIIEIELGEILKRALDRLVQRIARLVRPIGDFFMGRSWKGPAMPGQKLTLGLSDLERDWALKKPAPVKLANHHEIAARYAPVIHQEITRGRFDLLRRVDFDGDWNPKNNYENCTPKSDSSAFVYYDVKETKSHYFVTYVFYHAARESNAIGILANMRRHENDFGGCMVVARKGAEPGREVEVLVTANGSGMKTYSGLERKNGKKTRWKTRYGHWSGSVNFVDEADHRFVDLDRTHPQVWVAGKDHDVYGFNGRKDHDPFEGDKGVVYHYTGKASQPQGPRDLEVGYALKPLGELLVHPRMFRGKKVRATDGRFALRGRLAGDTGLDDRAVAPWAWRYWAQEEGHQSNENETRRAGDWIEAGDFFVDPYRCLGVLFHLEGFEGGYTRNLFLSVPEAASNDSDRGLRQHIGRRHGSSRRR
jgi:hypothetical protein